MKRLSTIALLVVLATVSFILPGAAQDTQANVTEIIKPHVDRCRTDLQWCATERWKYVVWYSVEVSSLISALSKGENPDCKRKAWSNAASGISQYRQYGVMVPEHIYNEVGKGLQGRAMTAADREKIKHVEAIVRSGIEADKKHLELKLAFADAALKAKCYVIADENYKDVMASASGRTDLAPTIRGRAQAGLDEVRTARR